MPRPKVPDIWRQAVFSLAQNEPQLGSKAIERQLEALAKHLGRTDWPSDRAIRRLLAEFRVKTEEERRQYARFYWPEAMDAGIFPWEASGPLLELLRHLHQGGYGRPVVRLARWFWQVTLAAPDASIEIRHKFATLLAGLEMSGPIPPLEARRFEWVLAYGPWRSDDDRDAYKAAQEFKLWVERVPSISEGLQTPLPPGTDLETLDEREARPFRLPPPKIDLAALLGKAVPTWLQSAIDSLPLSFHEPPAPTLEAVRKELCRAMGLDTGGEEPPIPWPDLPSLPEGEEQHGQEG